MEKNVLIVNFNTQKLTEACIKSVNKCMGSGCTIYIFDNSNKEPFINNFDNVKVLDNTKEQLANFTEILDRHRDFHNNGALDNDYGSMKHCLSVEKAMDIIEDGFVLMDSDILIKKDFSILYDEKNVFVGKKEKMKPFKMRVEPFLLFINVKMCKQHNIHFFDEDHMFGFYNANGGENYDTGCWFYEACSGLPRREIDTRQYMIHFRGASWFKEKDKSRRGTPERWLERNKIYWQDSSSTTPKPVVLKLVKKETPPKIEENLDNNLDNVSKNNEEKPESRQTQKTEKPIKPVAPKEEPKVPKKTTVLTEKGNLKPITIHKTAQTNYKPAVGGSGKKVILVKRYQR